MKTSNGKLAAYVAKTAALWLLLMAVTACPAAAQPLPGGGPMMPRPARGMPEPRPAPELTNAPANYLVRVEWKETGGNGGSIEVLTGEGNFQLSSSLPGTGKSDEAGLQIPVTLNGNLKVINSDKGQLQLFLGRSIPYTVSSPGQLRSIQQRQEGLTVTFFVTFGKQVVAQKDGNGEVFVLVKQQAL